jgi:hypothetical protein
MKTNWVISAMECTVQDGDMSDVVILVHWRFQGRQTQGDKEYFAEVYGATTVGQPDPENFTPFDQLTQEQVVGWLEESLDVEKMTEGLQENIDAQINPVTVTLPPSWNTPPTPPTPNV